MQAFFALATALLFSQANGFGWGLLGGGGGGCGCSAPPPCAPPPPPVCGPPPVQSCAPQPSFCPPPPPPPPQQACPQPQPCPVCQPPPPPPCPPPPPPPAPCPPPPPQQPCPQPQPQFQSCAPPPQAHNDCCNQCNSPCRFKSRRVFGVIAQRNVNAMCNNDKLRNIMLDNLSASTSESKRAIQKAAEDKLGGKYDVICATGEFSYVVHSNSFCQETLNNVTCYAFRH